MRAWRLILCLVLVPVAVAGQSLQRPPIDTAPFWSLLRPAQAFDCSNATCEQIQSCEEACYKLLICGHRRRDGDNDGIPCENLCSRRC